MRASCAVVLVAFAAFVAVAHADGVTRLPDTGEKRMPMHHEKMMQAFASEEENMMKLVKEAKDFADQKMMKMKRLSLADVRGQGEASSSEKTGNEKEAAGKGQMIVLRNSRDVLGRRGGPFLYAATIVRHGGDGGVSHTSPGEAMAILTGSLMNLPRGIALGIQGGEEDEQEFVNEVMRAFDCPRMRQRMLDRMMMHAQMQRDMWSNRLPGSDERTSFHQYGQHGQGYGQGHLRYGGHDGMSDGHGMRGWHAMEHRMPMIHDASELLRMQNEDEPEMHHWWDKIPFLSDMLQEEDISDEEMPRSNGQKTILGQDPITWGPNGFKMRSGKLEVIPLDGYKEQSAYSSIDWRIWDDEGNLNYGAILFMFLVGACAAVWLSLMVQIFECMFGSADDEEYVILSDDDEDDLKCDAFYYHAKSGSIVTAEGVPVDDVAFIKGAIVINKTSDEHVEKA